MKPALAVQAIFSFVASWNNYFIPALVLDSADKKTLPILIAQLRSADFLKFDMGKVYMMVAIAILPVIIVYLLLSKFIVRGVAFGRRERLTAFCRKQQKGPGENSGTLLLCLGYKEFLEEIRRKNKAYTFCRRF